MKLPRLQRGFTLIEVLIATALLTVLAVGLLASTWRLARFSQNQVDTTVAAELCDDLWLAVNSMKFDDIKNKELKVGLDALPKLATRDIFGRETIVYPMWRILNKTTGLPDSSKAPKLIVKVMSDSPSNKFVSVSAKWYGLDMTDSGLEREYSPDEGKTWREWRTIKKTD